MPITAELRRITEDHATLTLPEASALMRRLLAGEASDLELAALLGALAARGETAAEIAGFAVAMRAVATPLPLTPAEQAELVDTCGTGGDASGTFNISTAAALVAAAAGAKVAKHGNRAVTSRCGSADVLEALGIPVNLSPAAAADALRRHNFCFLLAPAHHPAMRAVMPVRGALGVRTIFNVVGPLLNPAEARRQVMGVYSPRLPALVAEAMTMLDTKHALVVHGAVDSEEVFAADLAVAHREKGMDELSLSGPSTVAEVHLTDAGCSLKQYEITPQELGLSTAPLAAVAGGDAQQNAKTLRDLFGLDGRASTPGPRHDVVAFNAAAVLVVAGLASNLSEGLALAQETLRSGAAAKLVRALQGS